MTHSEEGSERIVEGIFRCLVGCAFPRIRYWEVLFHPTRVECVFERK